MIVEGVPPEGERLDRYLTRTIKGITRSQIKERADHIEVNGVVARLSHRVHGGDRVYCAIGPVERVDLVAEDVDFDILWETDLALVVNKPAGLVVHPGAGNTHNTLVNGLLRHIEGLAGTFGKETLRPGIVHRLDKDTSGVMAVAKTPLAHEQMARQFRDRRVRKMYLSICSGIPRPRAGSVSGRMSRDPKNRKRFRLEPYSRAPHISENNRRSGDALAGTSLAGKSSEGETRRGKPSESLYRVLAVFGDLSLVAWRPITGRTHQLRVHSVQLRCPILGDALYSRSTAPRMYLHAYALELTVPPNQNPQVFVAPPTGEFFEPLEAQVAPRAGDALQADDGDASNLKDALVAGQDLLELLFPRSSAGRGSEE